MQNILKRATSWITPVGLSLFLLCVLLVPLAIGFTFAGSSEAPNLELTYTKGKLTWDSSAVIREDGSAEIDLFSSNYMHTVISSNGEKVVAPGTHNSEIVRLTNKSGNDIKYVAVLYEIKANPLLPIYPMLYGNGFSDTTKYSLPHGVIDSQVRRAVTGTVKANQIQDFDVFWQWVYENHANIQDGDAKDTYLGNEQPLSGVTVGLYIVVEDDNALVLPQTGDASQVGAYLGLVLACILIVGIYAWERRWESTCRRQ